jgi:peptidoglycan/xylan/chitin deacetylase (PgdA/CDA1 family)
VDTVNYKKFTNSLGRLFRNDLNQFVEEVDTDIKNQKQRVDDLITGTPQPSEVVDARGGMPLLRDRLDKVDAEMAQTETQLSVMQGVHKGYDGAVLTFIDDNGRTEFMNSGNLYDVFKAKGVSAGLGVITGRIGTNPYPGESYLTKQQLLNLQEEGFEIYPHTVTHPNYWEQLTDNQIRQELRDSQKYIKDNGFHGHDVFVYSSGIKRDDVRVKNIVREFYKYGINIRTTAPNAFNITPIDNWAVERIDGDNTSLTSLKNNLDLAIQNKAWLVVYLHSFNQTSTQLQVIADFIDYAKGVNVPILPFKQAEEFKGNVIAEGEYTSEFKTFISRDGRSTHGKLTVEEDGSRLITDLLTKFPRGLTATRITTSNDTLFNKGGTLLTHNYFSQSIYSFQQFKPYNEDVIYRRTWSGSSWGKFENDQNVLFRPLNNGSVLTAPITTFPEKTTSFYPVSSHAIAPETKAGEYTVKRHTPDIEGYGWSEYKILSSNVLYRRRWDTSTGSWTTWEKVSGV